jgi:hypothetical protein
MRIGYWRTLIRRLQAKVASGENTYVHRDGVFSIATVDADLDAKLDQGGELRLANDSQGNSLLLDVRTAKVLIVYSGSQQLPVSEDLVKFIQALRSLSPPGMELGPLVDTTIDFVPSRRGILDGY